MTRKHFRRIFKQLIALVLIPIVLVSSGSTAIALDVYRAAYELAEQIFELNPEQGVTVTLSGLMPVGGHAEAVSAEVEGEDVLHAYDITIYYAGGSAFEPAEDEPISVTFESDAIAQAIGEDDTTLEVEHIADSGEVESVAVETASDGELAFEAESFSVYVIRTHATNDENLKPRKTFHFLSPNYTQITEGDTIYYQSAAYQFPNKLNELVTTQTVTDGEALQEIVLPDNNTSGLFYGWYQVNYVSESDGLYTYYWGSSEPRHVAFNEPISVNEDDDTDVYLAPLFGHYRFLTFHQDVEDSPNANTIITRKLITLGEDRKCTLKISDVRAPSSNPNRIIFWGWEYQHREGDQQGVTERFNTVAPDDTEIEQTLTIYDPNVIAGRQPSKDDLKNMIFDIWPVFREARWTYFESGGDGANYVPPQFIMLDEPPTGFSNVPTRAGWVFQGWYYDIKDGNTVKETVQVTDENANIRAIKKQLADGVLIDDGKLVMTHAAEEQTFYAKWLPATEAKYRVIVWQQKRSDDKNAPDEEKTYDYRGYVDISGSTSQDATATAAFISGRYTDLVNYDSGDAFKKADFIGFHYNPALTTVTDNGYGTDGNKVNPNGSTVVNLYYDRDLMSVTYHFQSSHLPSGTRVTDGGYTYIATISNTGEQFGYLNGEYVPLNVSSAIETAYSFSYKYTSSATYNEEMYGIVNGEYAPLTREIESYSYSYNLQSGYRYQVYNGTSTAYGIYNNGFVTVYYRSSDRTWYRTKSGTRYSNPYTGTRYSRGSNTSTAAYNGTRYIISGNALTQTDAQTADGGTLYGLSNGYYIPLRVTATPNYRYTYNGAAYTGTRYMRDTDNTFYTDTLYQKTESGFIEAVDTDGDVYGLRNGAYEMLTKSADATIYTWRTGNDDKYTGTRYLRFQTSEASDYGYKVVWTGLYGQPFSQYGYVFPSEYQWNDGVRGQTLLSDFNNQDDDHTVAITDYQLYCQGDALTGTLYHLRQKLDGTYSTDPEYCAIAHLSTGNITFTFTNKFDGYDVCGYSTTFRENGPNANETVKAGDTAGLTPSTNVYYVYHKGYSTLQLVFNDNYNGNTKVLQNMKYGQSLEAYADAYTPAPRDHFTFTGWYEDESATKRFEFNSAMPAANKMVYAGWRAVRYRVTVDPDGGEFPLGGNFSTFFKVNYDELITEYSSTRREYVEDPNGEYLYACFLLDKVDGMVLPSGKAVDLDGEFRKAFYLKKTEIRSTYDAYFTAGGKLRSYSEKDENGNETVMTYEQFRSCIDMNTTYSPADSGTMEYRLLSWHKVRADGTEEQTPFNFKNRVSEDTHLRARWVRLGKYSLTYDPTMTGTEITGTMARYNDPLESDRKFSDKSPVIILQEPTDLQFSDGANAENYVFRGWRIVDGKTKQPLEDDKFYDPGDTMILDARLADTQGVIHMEAYYEKKESTVRRVDVTSLTLDANAGEKGVVNSVGLANDRYEYADTANKQIKIERQNNNFAVNLKNYIKNFSHTDGNFLLGWNTTTPAEDYIPEYYADAFIGVNKNDMPNNLYAVWEPMVYLTLQNNTKQPVTFTLKFTYDGTVYAGHANTMTGEYERQAFSKDENVSKDPETGVFSVVLPPTPEGSKGVQLVLPEGEGATYTVSGTYADNTTNKTLIVYNSGDTVSTTISKTNGSWYKNGTYQRTTPVPYETSGTLVKGLQGQTVIFSEENPRTELNLKARYYDLTTESWVDETSTVERAEAHFTLPTGYSERVSADGYTTTVDLINNNKTTTFGLSVNSYDSDNYKFIGWYTSGEASPNAYTVDGIANGFGAASVSGLAVPSDTTTYYALFVPYVKGALTIVHNEREDSAGHCADVDGLKLDIEYTDNGSVQTWSAVGDKDHPATYTLGDDIIDEKNTTGHLKVTVSAKPHEGSVYKTTYRNQTQIPDENITLNPEGYSTAVFEASVSDQFADSETVKGLRVLRTVSFSSVFTRGYKITYKYTARDGQKKEYVLSGAADTFDDFSVFVIEHTPYQRTLTGDTVWDIENMKLEIDDYGMNAVLEEKPNIRDYCTVTIAMPGGYTPSERVEYGETFTEEQALRRIPPASNSTGEFFDYWEISNTDTKEHIANCYSEKFTFAVWNNYTITPHYSVVPEQKAEEGTFITIDYIDTSRNRWGAVNDDETDVTDKVVADVDISFIDGSRKILDTVDENGNHQYQLGVIFEICGTTEDGSFNAENYSFNEEAARQRVADVLRKAKPSSTGTDIYSGEKTNYYYSRIAISADTVSTFNRSEFTRSFTTATVKNRVLRMYAYMVTPEGLTVLSAPKYISMYQYAAPEYAIQ